MSRDRPWKMRSQYNGRCKSCGTPYAVGEEIFYCKEHGAQCLECGQQTLDLYLADHQEHEVPDAPSGNSFCGLAQVTTTYLTSAKSLRQGLLLCPECRGWVPHHDPAAQASQYCPNCGTRFTWADSLREIADSVDMTISGQVPLDNLTEEAR